MIRRRPPPAAPHVRRYSPLPVRTVSNCAQGPAWFRRAHSTCATQHRSTCFFADQRGFCVPLASVVVRGFRPLLHSAGLRTIRFHDLRHSTATLLLEQGVDLVVIKELLGHAHIGVTAGVYAHVRLRLQRQAIDTLGGVLSQTAVTVAVKTQDAPFPVTRERGILFRSAGASTAI
ncbi:tyrosine-type recombinase/integrase [Streptomyces albidoflavus]|nr:tyrosine-type recombinase/integrase [Streptomyces albidoflavus]